MDAITAARELGKAIQADDKFVKMMLAQQKSDEDAGLQEQINVFNQKRGELNAALHSGDGEKDHAQIAKMDAEIKELYQQIFQNEHMAAFSTARGEVDEMLSFVNQIITGSAQGLDPDAIQYQESCGGDCGGCSGCH